MRLGIAAESSQDAALVARIGDRVLEDRVPWTRDQLDDVRTWVGAGGAHYLDLHGARRRRPVFGHFRGEPGAADAQMVRSILVEFALDDEEPEVVVVSRDIDDEPDRKIGFDQARDERDWPFTVIGAHATPELEAWAIAIWTAETDPENTALAKVRQRLGYDPTRYPERLTSKRITDKADAKRVLGELTEVGRSSTDRWESASLAEMTRLTGCGLDAFVLAFGDCVATRFGGVSPGSRP